MKDDYIYMDYASSTPVREEVLEVMQSSFTLSYGNPSASNHALGEEASREVEKARKDIASLLGVQRDEIIFTSGATEAINTAIKGCFKAYRKIKGNHFISVKTEHKAVLNTLRAIEKEGAEITLLDVLSDGRVDTEELRSAIRKDTVMVAIMHGNNETGVLHPVEQIGQICKEEGVIFFCDATQSFGKVPLIPRKTGIHMMALSAHKSYGPKGVGALYCSGRAPRIRFVPLLHGGGQEGGLRSGTHNVPAIVGFGQVARWMQSAREEVLEHLLSLQSRLESGLRERIEGVVIHGSNTPRLPHITNVSFQDIDTKLFTETLSQHLAFSTGSACNTHTLEPSHVLLAMGISGAMAHNAVRLSYGYPVTVRDMDRVLLLLEKAVQIARRKNTPFPLDGPGGDQVLWE